MTADQGYDPLDCWELRSRDGVTTLRGKEGDRPCELCGTSPVRSLASRRDSGGTVESAAYLCGPCTQTVAEAAGIDL